MEYLLSLVGLEATNGTVVLVMCLVFAGLLVWSATGDRSLGVFMCLSLLSIPSFVVAERICGFYIDRASKRLSNAPGVVTSTKLSHAEENLLGIGGGLPVAKCLLEYSNKTWKLQNVVIRTEEGKRFVRCSPIR